MTRYWIAGLFIAVLWLAACRPDNNGGGDGDADGDVDCEPGRITCSENVARTCNGRGDGWSSEVECTGATPVCSPGIGCVLCIPGTTVCQGNDVMRCNTDATAMEFVMTCPEGDTCANGRCSDPCSQARADNSYEGCEYVAVTLMNSQLSTDFVPAIVVGNRNGQEARVTVTRGGSPVAEATVAPNSTQTIELPWVMELKQDLDPLGESQEQSVNVPNGSYRVVSTLPVTVYQFNPLEYGLPHDCVDDDQMPGDGMCYSYSNDASLLLPVHVLTGHYLVMSRPDLGIHMVDLLWGDEQFSFSPSTLAVVNPQDHDVQVNVTFSCPTQAGPGMSAYEAGQSGSFTVGPGGVLQIAARIPETCTDDFTEQCYDDVPDYQCGYCDLTEYDLTGTEISSGEPVAVFGGHNCAFVPFNRWACDHLEEQIFPYETWGKQFVVTQVHRENGEPDVWRVLSGADNNLVRFDPSSVHGEVRLNRGQHVEFEARGAFAIQAEQPILVGQFIVGQSYNDLPTGSEMPPGDPAFSLAVPSEQWRSAYNFLAPSSYDRSYVNITTTDAGRGSIELDGANLGGAAWEPISGSGYFSLRHQIDPGSHGIRSTSSATFGIAVYGYGQYTSYMYPGGLNLEQIAIW
jgi:hypothetical protein